MPLLCSAGDRHHVAKAEPAEVFGLHLHRFGIDLVHGEKDILPPRCSRRASSISGAASSVRASTTMMMASVLPAQPAPDGNISAGMSASSSGTTPPVFTKRARWFLPLDLTVDAITGDAGLIADDRAAASREAIEERRFTDVGATADSDQRQAGCIGCFSGGRDARLINGINDPPVAFVCLWSLLRPSPRASSSARPSCCRHRRRNADYGPSSDACLRCGASFPCVYGMLWPSAAWGALSGNGGWRRQKCTGP